MALQGSRPLRCWIGAGDELRRGGTVVAVKAADDQAASVEAILDGATPIDRNARIAEYRQEGWTRFDEKAEPYKGTTII